MGSFNGGKKRQSGQYILCVYIVYESRSTNLRTQTKICLFNGLLYLVYIVRLFMVWVLWVANIAMNWWNGPKFFLMEPTEHCGVCVWCFCLHKVDIQIKLPRHVNSTTMTQNQKQNTFLGRSELNHFYLLHTNWFFFIRSDRSGINFVQYIHYSADTVRNCIKWRVNNKKIIRTTENNRKQGKVLNTMSKFNRHLFIRCVFGSSAKNTWITDEACLIIQFHWKSIFANHSRISN